jgi:hypothetical protein
MQFGIRWCVLGRLLVVPQGVFLELRSDRARGRRSSGTSPGSGSSTGRGSSEGRSVPLAAKGHLFGQGCVERLTDRGSQRLDGRVGISGRILRASLDKEFACLLELVQPTGFPKPEYPNP